MIEFLEARIAPALVLTNTGQLGNHTFSDALMVTDHSGNIIVVGRFTGTLDLDMTSGTTNVTTTDPDGDIFIAKYDSNFGLVWTQTWGGVGFEQAFDVITDGSDEVYVTGQFGSASTGFGGVSGSLSASVASPQTFVLKMLHTSGAADTNFSGDGQLSFGNGTNATGGRTLAIDTNGGLLVGGEFSGTSNGIEGSGMLDAVSGMDGYVIRLLGNGTSDSSFGTGIGGGLVFNESGSLGDSVFKIKVHSNGDLFIGTESTFSTPQGAFATTYVSRIDPSGYVPVSGWGGGKIGINASSPQSPTLADFTVDSAGRMLVARTTSGSAVVVLRHDATTGDPDNEFGNSGVGFLLTQAQTVSITVDGDDLIYVGGETATKNYVGRLNSSGLVDTKFGTNGVALFGGTVQGTPPGKLAMAFDASGKLVVRGTFQGSPDFDPSKSVKKLTERSVFLNNPTMSDGFIARFDPNGLAAGQSLTFPGGFNEGGLPISVVVTFTGPGRVEVTPDAEGGPGALGSIVLFDTTLASKLTVKVINGDAPINIGRVITAGSAQDMGSIILDPGTLLGGGISDSNPDLVVTGRATTLVLGDLRNDTLIRLGEGLPYNAVNPAVSDTYNNKPNLTIGHINGSGVVIDVTGDGVTPQGVGGGGLGTVIIKSWANEGVLRTTQSIGSFTILEGNFGAILEVDKLGLGEGTTANVGSMTVANGNWGSNGSVIEGAVGVFDVEEFLSSAAIQAGSVTTVRTASGGFNGTLTLTDTAAKGVATFTVASDFTGKIVSASPLKKLNIKGDFKGSLTAPSIAGITALSFDGTTLDDMEGDPEKLNITTTAGLLGLITAKSGVIKNFEFSTPGNFSGIKVVKSNLLEPTVGIQNVNISAANIGPVTVQLTGKSTALGLDLTGILNSSFTTAGKMGNVTVKIAGASGAALGMQDVNLSAGSFSNVLVSVTKGKALTSTAQGVVALDINATTNIGAVSVIGDATLPQAVDLQITAGGKIKGVSVKSKNAAMGVLQDSGIRSGQLLDLTGITDLKTLKTRLANAGLGAVSVSGNMTGSLIASGGAIAAVTVGGNLSQSTITAGALLGDNRAVGGGDDTFHLGGQIGAVTVKGSYSSSSVAVGVKAVDGVFGNGDDAVADSVGEFTLVSAIKSLNIGSGVSVLNGPIAAGHTYGIEAGKIGKLTVNKQPVTDFSAPFLLDAEGPGEGPEDILVRIIA